MAFEDGFLRAFEAEHAAAIVANDWRKEPVYRGYLEAFEDDWDDALDFYSAYFKSSSSSNNNAEAMEHNLAGLQSALFEMIWPAYPWIERIRLINQQALGAIVCVQALDSQDMDEQGLRYLEECVYRGEGGRF